jgi:ubiquinone biosynthesis protein
VDMQVSAQHALPLHNLRRMSSIASVLVKHGWGHYVGRLRLKSYLPTAAALVTATGLSDAERLRLALEELGPTFVKFGQLLSVRQDLFPEEITTELQKLQDAVAPFPPAQARQIIAHELGHPVGRLFAAFDDAPLAAASIAQVHTATLLDGTAAVVKVQRPGIEQVIHADLEILFACARLLHQYVPESRRYDPMGLVEEFADTIVKELDFRLEGHNSERFSANFKDEPAVYVPRIFWNVSSKRILTQERSTGHRAAPGDPADPNERRRVAATIARLFLTQLFEHGYFHGDPHPGNVFIMHDGRLCFHDFGIVGRLSPHDQENLRLLVLAVVTRDAEAMADLYFNMGVAAAGVDRDAFARDLSKALEQYYSVSAHAYSFGEILRQFVRLGQRYQIRMPREWLLVVKAFMVIESQASAIDAEFSMITALQDYTPRMLGRQLMPDMNATAGLVKGYRAISALKLLALGLPEGLEKGLRQLQKGETTLRVRHEQLDQLERHIDRASNRLSFSLIISAIVIASSIVMSFHTGPHLEGIPLLGLIGYGLAAFLGLWWAIAIARSGKL